MYDLIFSILATLTISMFSVIIVTYVIIEALGRDGLNVLRAGMVCLAVPAAALLLYVTHLMFWA